MGQNFLYDPSILRRIIQAARLIDKDTVVEIGPGPGRLTAMLSVAAGRVIAIELDRGLYERLRAAPPGTGNVELVWGDALKFPYENIRGPFKVVSNIPYHITTPIIFRLLEHRDRLVSMTLTVQKEVARRVAASPGGRDYGVLSLMVQYHGRASMEFAIPRGAFRPVPKVDSACLHVEVYGRPAVDVKDEGLLFTVIRAAFSQRRKTVYNALKRAFPGVGDALKAAGIEHMRRPETLGLGEFALLADCLYARR